MSYGLKAGKTYPYTVAVVVPQENGQPVRLTKTIYVKAGDEIRLAFTGEKTFEQQFAEVTR